MATAKQRMVAEPKTNAPPPEKKSSRQTRTMAEIGSQLPVGMINAEGVLEKSLSVRIWRTKEERELGKLKKPKMNLASYVSTILSYMCTSFGRHNWPDTPQANTKQSDERRAVLSQAFIGDIFYAYCFLRREALGTEIKTKVTCPNCGDNFPFSGDLDTIEVVTVDNVEDLLWTFDLSNPIEIRKQKVQSFRMTSPRWAMIEQTASVAPNNEALAKITAVRGAIIGLNDDPQDLVLMENELDELTKRDFERLMAEVDQNFTGPKMSLEGVCRKCAADFRSPIDWNYERFFSASSR